VAIHRRFGIFRLGANYSLSDVSCGAAEKVLRTGEQSGDKSPQSKKMQNSNLASAKQLLSQHSCGIGFQPVNSVMTG
jgi:hypothetical protein